MEKIPHHSHDSIRDNFEKIQKLFPSVVHEVKDENGNIKKELDIDELKKLFDNNFAENIIERYSLNWPGKRKSLIKANTPITDTLRPARDESVDFDTTKNLYIEWDNFAVLKTLQHAYMGKVKMIYIDPPYNTGKDFVYNDNFTEDIASYREKTGEIVDGVQMEKNTDTNGRFHSDWLSMMYERLIVARDLLTEDGVIFMSMDENEFANLKKISDEIFGEENYLAEFIRKTKSTTNDSKTWINYQHEFLLCYARNFEKIFRLSGGEKDLEKYKNPDNDANGAWVVADPSAKSGTLSNNYFPVVNPYTWQEDFPPNGRFWAFSKNTIQEHIDSGRISFKKSHKPDERWFIYKRYLNDLKTTESTFDSLAFVDNKFMNQSATKLLKEMWLVEYFQYPKWVEFLKDIIFSCTKNNDIILDFFSGSATTAHAVMQLNAEDGGNRQFILVQIPELVDDKSEAKKAGYNNICEIGKERIRRAATKIREDFATQIAERETPLDTGFRVYKLDSTNYQNNDILPQDMSQQNLDNFIDTFKSGRTPEDILTEILLREGQVLSGNIETKIVWNNTLYIIDGGIVACLDKTIDNDTIKAIVDIGPHSVILLDEAFSGDDAMKINTEQLFKKSLGEEVLIKIF